GPSTRRECPAYRGDTSASLRPQPDLWPKPSRLRRKHRLKPQEAAPIDIVKLCAESPWAIFALSLFLKSSPYNYSVTNFLRIQTTFRRKLLVLHTRSIGLAQWRLTKPG